MGRHYDNPPVVEALCEVYFAGSTWDDASPGAFFERIRDRFPKRQQANEVNVELRVEVGVASARAVSNKKPRWQFRVEDGSRMVQVGQDLLVVNQLRPYTHFEDWQPILMEMVELYRELAKPAGIGRIGVRYLNKVIIPHSPIQMEDYFQVYPQVPDSLGALHGPFLMRLTVPAVHVSGHQLLLTLSTTEQDRADELALLLDLYDVFTPIDSSTPGLVAQSVEEAHANIEHAFESAITDQARNLFEEKTDATSAA